MWAVQNIPEFVVPVCDGTNEGVGYQLHDCFGCEQQPHPYILVAHVGLCGHRLRHRQQLLRIVGDGGDIVAQQWRSTGLHIVLGNVRHPGRPAPTLVLLAGDVDPGSLHQIQLQLGPVDRLVRRLQST